MDSIYLVCAIACGSLLVLTFVLSLFSGMDADIDTDMDSELDTGDAGDAFVKVLSLKALISGGTFFGLSGLAARQFELSPPLSLGIAVVAGMAAIYVVAQLMASLANLQSKGNLDLQNACGAEARCYLRVPPKGKGTGRVTVTLQGRNVECKAVSNGSEIPTGAAVRVIAVRSPTTLEVAPLVE